MTEGRALKSGSAGPTITLPRYHIAVSFPKKRHMRRIFLFLAAKRIMPLRVIAGPRNQPFGSTTF
jgi:hypothetical protein